MLCVAYPSIAGIVNALVSSNVTVSEIPEINLKGNPANVALLIESGRRVLFSSLNSKEIFSPFLYYVLDFPSALITIR